MDGRWFLSAPFDTPGNVNETKPVKEPLRQPGFGEGPVKCSPSEGSSDAQEVPLFPVLHTRGRSEIAGK